MAPMIVQRIINEELRQALLAEGHCDLLARVLASRHLGSSQEARLDFNQLPHFSLLKNIDLAVDLVAEALIQQKKIVIAGDYDADGATATALAVLVLREFGGQVSFIAPSREKDGYGLSETLVDKAMALDAQLIITVDNGIAAVESVDYAQQLGIQVLVTDHHLPGKYLPNCPIVNPNQFGCSFPSKNLAGVGVMFYVLVALRHHLEKKHYFDDRSCRPNLAHYLDIVALGTVADVVILDQVNRIFVNHGLKIIHAQQGNKGILALLKVSGKNPQEVMTRDLGFIIGPRINAAGRLEDIRIGIKCLLANQDEEAYAYAVELNALNHDRRNREKTMVESSLLQLSGHHWYKKSTITLFSEDFHQGIIGLVASRLKEKYHLPTIVFAAGDGDELKGSGRSVEGLHLRDILDQINKCAPGIIIRFGGHAAAAGLSLKRDSLTKFQHLFEMVVDESLPEGKLEKKVYTDGALLIGEMTLENARMLNNMVWGQGFEAPLFWDSFFLVRQKQMGADKRHKKAWLMKNGQIFEAMFFNCEEELPEHIALAYQLMVNRWKTQLLLQLYVEYWQAVLDG